MLKISHLFPKISPQEKIPPKTVTIVHKSGKDIIKDEFVGFHHQCANPLEVLNDLVDSLFRLFGNRK